MMRNPAVSNEEKRAPALSLIEERDPQMREVTRLRTGEGNIIEVPRGLVYEYVDGDGRRLNLIVIEESRHKGK